MITNFIPDVQEITPLQQKDVSPPLSHQIEANFGDVHSAGVFAQKIRQEFGEKVSVIR